MTDPAIYVRMTNSVTHTHNQKKTQYNTTCCPVNAPCQRCCLQTTATRQQSGWASQLRIGKHCKHTKIDLVALSTQGTPQRQEKASARCLSPFDCRLCIILLSWNWYCILLGTTFSLKRTQCLPNAKINKHESGLIIMNLCTTMYYYVLIITLQECIELFRVHSKGCCLQEELGKFQRAFAGRSPPEEGPLPWQHLSVLIDGKIKTYQNIKNMSPCCPSTASFMHCCCVCVCVCLCLCPCLWDRVFNVTPLLGDHIICNGHQPKQSHIVTSNGACTNWLPSSFWLVSSSLLSSCHWQVHKLDPKHRLVQKSHSHTWAWPSEDFPRQSNMGLSENRVYSQL